MESRPVNTTPAKSETGSIFEKAINLLEQHKKNVEAAQEIPGGHIPVSQVSSSISSPEEASAIAHALDYGILACCSFDQRNKLQMTWGDKFYFSMGETDENNRSPLFAMIEKVKELKGTMIKLLNQSKDDPTNQTSELFISDKIYSGNEITAIVNVLQQFALANKGNQKIDGGNVEGGVKIVFPIKVKEDFLAVEGKNSPGAAKA